MRTKELTHRDDKEDPKRKITKRKNEEPVVRLQQKISTGEVPGQAIIDLRSLTPENVNQLQQTVGNQAARRLLSGRKTRRTIQLKPQHTSINNTIIQRLMSEAEFQELTTIETDKNKFSKGRDKVKEVDRALSDYHKIEPGELQLKIQALGKLLDECNTYLGLDDKTAKRKVGVRTLRNEAQTALDFVQKKLMQKDLDRLQEMANDPTLPLVTHDILHEELANVDKIEFLTLGSSAAFSDRKSAKDYFVSANMNESDPDKRLGSLAHELTHVAVSESYENTKMMWSFVRGLDDDSVMSLSTKRLGQIDELISLCESSGLSGQQKSLLKQQLEYAKRKHFIANEAVLEGEEDKETYKRLTNKKVNWSTLVEFDTNINQCLVLLASWKVPDAGPFYKRLQEIAKEAAAERGQAARKRAHEPAK